MSRKGEKNQELLEGQETTGPLTVATHIRHTVDPVLRAGNLLQNAHTSTRIWPNTMYTQAYHGLN